MAKDRKEAFLRTYRFCGEGAGAGAGIPGLPHTITEDQARALGVWETLQAALKNGSYREISANRAEEDDKP